MNENLIDFDGFFKQSYPESSYIAVDIFTCGRDPGNTGTELSERLGAMKYSSHFIKRGSQTIANSYQKISHERFNRQSEMA